MKRMKNLLALGFAILIGLMAGVSVADARGGGHGVGGHGGGGHGGGGYGGGGKAGGSGYGGVAGHAVVAVGPRGGVALLVLAVAWRLVLAVVFM